MKKYHPNKDLQVVIELENVYLDGILHIPSETQRLVVFVHGSGSGRLSPRNQHVAKVLNQAGMATLLFDLLTADEDRIDEFTREFRFDIPLLTNRLVDTTEWVMQQEDLQNLALGYFGASTGGAAALVAAAQKPEIIKAVVSRGGRPDLAGDALPNVEAPTLLIVGGDDYAVIEMNQTAMRQMQCINQLEIIPGATHLFEEPGKLDEVALLASAWFEKYLV